MSRGGVRFWLITGDHVETSLQIARQCRILRCADAQLLRLEEGSPAELRAAWERARAGLVPAGRSLVLTGRALAGIFAWDDCEAFFAAATRFDSVLCCRVTPRQKVATGGGGVEAEIVAWVQRAARRVTLAIGDGGNDVSMLLQSDCGVGIRGREGEQVGLPRGCELGGARGRLRGGGVSVAAAPAVRARSERSEPELDDHGVFAVQVGGAVRLPDALLAVHAVLGGVAVLLVPSHLLLHRSLRAAILFF